MTRVAAVLAILIMATAAHATARRVKTTGVPGTTKAVQNPDGAWRIESSTTVGTCGELIPGVLTIANHKIAGAGAGSGSSWGYVDEAGQIVARFTGPDGRVVRLHGNLRGAAGSGAWSSSTDMCGGVWRATRN